MTIPLWCLLGFVGWMFLLLAAIGIDHFALVGRGLAEPSGLKADEPHGSARHWRLHRAHLNCVETLPAVATVVLVATVAGLRSTGLDTLARVLLAARVFQSLAHIASGGNRAVVVRLTFFLVQWACLVGFGLVILRGA
jgi:uncharacterized MAPEG superfamily protein